MLRIERTANEVTVFRLSGRMDSEDVPELQAVIKAEIQDEPITLDLKDLTLVDLNAVRFLGHCESGSIGLRNCPAYIRAWIERERNGCWLAQD
jgi:hypothetical protein